MKAHRRLGWLVSLLVLALGGIAAGAGGATSGPVAPLPTLDSLTLGTDDFDRGKVTRNIRKTNDEGQSLKRSFADGSKVAGVRMFGVGATTFLFESASLSRERLLAVRGLYSSARSRAAIATEMKRAISKSLDEGDTVKQVIVSPPTQFGTDGALAFITVKLDAFTFSVATLAVRTDRALQVITTGFLGGRGAGVGAVRALGGAAREHMTEAFTVTSTALPAIVGTPVQGQILSVEEGTWRGAPAEFRYAWSRCDVLNVCVAIPGATSRTYTVTPGDVGSTIKATVIGGNSVSSSPVTSAATVAVTGPATPPAV